MPKASMGSSNNLKLTTVKPIPYSEVIIEKLDSKLNAKLRSLHSSAVSLHSFISATNETFDGANEVTKRLQPDAKLLSHYHRSKLKTVYSAALGKCNEECGELRKCLDDINTIKQWRAERRLLLRRNTSNVTRSFDSPGASHQPIRRGALMMLLQRSANALPLWVGMPGSQPEPLCGALGPPNGYVCNCGDMVAAQVKTGDNDVDDSNWILGEVFRFNSDTGMYEIDDIDEEQQDKHILSDSKVIPLPLMKINPLTDPQALFPPGAVVFALYPQTTCFYQGVVNKPPKNESDYYFVAFEDNSYPSGFSPSLAVPQRYVVAAPFNASSESDYDDLAPPPKKLQKRLL